MKTAILTSVLIVLLTGSTAAQQQNTLQAALWVCPTSFSLDGSNPPFELNLLVPAQVTLSHFGAPNQQTFLFGGALMAGALNTPFGIVDIDPGTAALLLQGSTDATGLGTTPVGTIPAAFAGFAVGLQSLVSDPTSPFNLTLTAAFLTTFTAGVGTDAGLGDDQNVAFPLTSFAFPFYGASMTTAFVNSNGSVSFLNGTNDFTETVSEFLAQMPRIALFWDDLTPAPNTGDLTWVERNGEAIVSWNNVPEFPNTGGNTGFIRIEQSGDVHLVYGGPAAITLQDAIVGITPGQSANPFPLDLSNNVPAGAPSFSAIFESFTIGSLFDLHGFDVVFRPSIFNPADYVVDAIGPLSVPRTSPGVSISGPCSVTGVNAGSFSAPQSFTATVTGGTAPYAFYWTVHHGGGLAAEEKASVQGSMAASNSQDIRFWRRVSGPTMEVLQVIVIDANGNSGTSSKQITVSP